MDIVFGNRSEGDFSSCRHIQDTKNSNTKIGVLGGIGPQSTKVLYQGLISKLQNDNLVTKNEEFPQIIINSIPAPELIYEDYSKNELIPYLEGLKELDKFNPDFIIMVCNTIHLFYKEFAQKINSPILNLRKEIKKYLEKENIKSILVIGTPLTIKKKLYEFENIKTYSPNKEETKKITEAVYNFNIGKDKKKQKQKVRNICNRYLKSKNINLVLLGCTELALMLKESKFRTLNTIEVLANSTINKFMELKNASK